LLPDANTIWFYFFFSKVKCIQSCVIWMHKFSICGLITQSEKYLLFCD
jgi:hypothetical protein